jgi:hypothetical protein
MARGASDKKEWSVPGPLRALLWWPAAAFVLVMVDMDNAAWTIALAGVVLVAIGFVGPIVACRIRNAAVSAAASAAQEAPTMEIEMPTIEMPKVQGEAAA